MTAILQLFTRPGVLTLIFLFASFYPACAQDTATRKSYDGEVMVLQKATKGNGIDIVFLGDAFHNADLAPGRIFENWMIDVCEILFALEPMKSMRGYFNVYAVKAASISRKYIPDKDYTCFGVNPMKGASASWQKSLAYSRKAPLIDSTRFFHMILTYDPRMRGGLAESRPKMPRAVASFSYDKQKQLKIPYMTNIIAHELVGHCIGKLADEYLGHKDESKVPENRKMRGAPNLSYTNNPDSIKWSAFLKNKDYKGKVGIYEGGGYYTKGVWRPSENSIMRNLKEGFNAPSRNAIYRNIKQLAGEEYSFEEFLQYDKINLRR